MPEQVCCALFEAGLSEVDFEEGVVADRVAVKWDPLADYDEGNVLGSLFGFILITVAVLEGEMNGLVEFAAKADDKSIDYDNPVGVGKATPPHRSATNSTSHPTHQIAEQLTRIRIELSLVPHIQVREHSVHVSDDPLPLVGRSKETDHGHARQKHSTPILVLVKRRHALRVLAFGVVVRL